MTNKEFQQKQQEIFRKYNLEIMEVIERLKNEGRWIGGLTSDPPEIKELKDKAYAEIAELAKKVE